MDELEREIMLEQGRKIFDEKVAEKCNSCDWISILNRQRATINKQNIIISRQDELIRKYQNGKT